MSRAPLRERNPALQRKQLRWSRRCDRQDAAGTVGLTEQVRGGTVEMVIVASPSARLIRQADPLQMRAEE